MLIENRSQYLLKKVRAKAKMYEYHIPSELHGKTESDANYLLILAIATIGDFSKDVIESYQTKEIDYTEHKKNLQFASVFFDAYLEAKMYEGDQKYYLLLGAVVYYLCDYNGSSKVLADKISDDINLDANGIDFVLSQILQGKLCIECFSEMLYLNEVVNAYNEFWSTGIVFDYKKLWQLKKFIYKYGTDRELLFTDALIATIFLKIEHSSYRLMPIYTQIDPEIWGDILRKKTLISELWQSQRQLGEAGVFAGKSATIQMPTSSGKTKSVALIILSAFLRKNSSYALVVAPFRSLCREITDELQRAFSYTSKIHVNEISDVMQMDMLDIILGNVPETEEKYVYIVTPEKLLFVLRQEIMFLSNIDLIIFDEGHLFDDNNRGITYELLISTIKSYMKDKVQKILISAVIPNAEQVNGWLTDERGVVIKNNIIQTTEKVVAMADMKKNTTSGERYAYLYFVNPAEPDEEDFFVPRVIKQTMLYLRPRERKVRVFPEVNDNKYKNDVAIAFGIKLCHNGSIAIFCGKKDTAEKILSRILEIKERGINVSNLLESADKTEIDKLCCLIDKGLGNDNDYYKAAKVGAFVHHGGMPMGIRCAVEYAMQTGKISFLACTSTLAQGVNLPIRYLIVSNIYQGKDRIRVRDFQNLIGRAGRAGIYTEGTIILSETNVYNTRNNPYYNWRWNNYKRLLDSDQAEACTSTLFAWLRADEGMEVYLEKMIEIFMESYANGDFNEKMEQYLKEQQFEEENHKKAEFMMYQMKQNIEAIESFLLFYLMEDTYEESREDIHIIINETLAFYLAGNKERIRLLRIVDLIGEFLVHAVDTVDKRSRYSKSLLGVRKEIEIEQWVSSNYSIILEAENEKSIMQVVFPLLLRTENQIVRNCINSELLNGLAEEWIAGKTYSDLTEYVTEHRIMVYKRKHPKIMSLQDVITFCDNFLGYDCTLILAAIIENVMYLGDDNRINNILKMLSKRMRYGLAGQTSILLYEMGFNDRGIAMKVGNMLEEVYQPGNRKELIRLIRKNKGLNEKIRLELEKYPSYFCDKWEELHR